MLALAIIPLLLSANAFAQCTALDPLRARWRPQLQQVVRAGLEMTREADVVPFHTHHDWHSSVHAHWTLLTMARDAGDAELEREVRARLVPEALAEIDGVLQRNPKFELPYGRAWLLLLLDELERAGPSTELVELRARTEERVLDWLEDEFNRFQEHDSWILSYWLTGQSRLTPRGRASYDKLASDKLTPKRRRKLAEEEPEAGDFVDSRALLDLVEGNAGVRQLELSELPEVITLGNAHTAGRAFLELWPLAAKANQDAATCARLVRELERRLARRDLWETPFKEVGHWTPQYAWMAFWLARRGE